jgi:hypothetical protein
MSKPINEGARPNVVLTQEKLAARFAEFGVTVPPSAAERWPELGVPLDPYMTLKRREAAETLTKIGRPLAYRTLNTLASRGGGPPYELNGPASALYQWAALLKWSQGRMSAPRTTATEGRAQADKVARNREQCERRDARNKARRAERRAAREAANKAGASKDKASAKAARSKVVVGKVKDRRQSAPDNPPPAAPARKARGAPTTATAAE